MPIQASAIGLNADWGPARWALTVLALLALCLVAWSLIEARTPRIRRAVLSDPGLPVAFDGLRIVFVADIHAGPYLGRAGMRLLVDRLNDLEPDLVILGGDYVGGRASGTRTFYSEIGRLDAPLGVFAVLGNHDYWEGVDVAIEGMRAAGITLLVNANTTVTRGPESIYIAGVDDVEAGSPDLAQTAAGIRPEDFAILISHSPDFFPDALPEVSELFDLALAGHTHGGQLTFFGGSSPLLPSAYGQRFRGGWVEESGVPVLVTRGAGNVTVPMRFFAPPEINVVVLERGPLRVTC